MSVDKFRTWAIGVLVSAFCLLLSSEGSGADRQGQRNGNTGSSTAAADTLSFRNVIIDPNPPRQPHCKAIGDIDGDGFPDVMTASSTNFTEGLFWYRYPTWEKFSVHPGSFTTDMQVGDVDGDGDLDAIIPKGKYKGESVWWYENPMPDGDPTQGPWKEHFVGTAGSHDVEVGDVDKDGKLDVVVRDITTTVFFQDTLDQWIPLLVSSRPHEGTAVGDVDGDGDLDVAITGHWLENPLPGQSPRTAPWTEHLVNADWPAMVSARIADINHDGRMDILYVPSESAHGRFAWYEATDPRTGPWTEHVIDADVSYSHTFKTADMDEDGTLDIVTAEMHQAVFPRRVTIYFNVNGDASTWTKQILSTRGSHNIRVGDIGNDGDLDIIGANWGAEAEGGSPLEMWENIGSSDSGSLSLDKWKRHVVDPDRPWRAIFVTAGDLDGDVMPDIVAGAWWYKNPGMAGGTWTRHEVGSPLNNMAAVYDFDNDGTLDVLGTQGVDAASNSQFAWARNDGAGNFTVLDNIQQANGTFLQGTAVARFSPSGPLEVALSWHESAQGMQMLTVPGNPSTDPWPWRSISTTSQNEQVSAGDIDRDGDADLLMGTAWLRNDGTTWTPLTLNETTIDVDRSQLADVNRDGRLDAVIGFETSTLPGLLAWYEQPEQADQTWTEHIITTDIIGAQSVDVADLDHDGDLDVVAGEHNLTNPAAARLLVFENADGQGGTWTPHLIHTGDEHHDGAQTVDIDDDGDLDIVSIGWTHGQVLLYENLSRGTGIPGGSLSITTQPRNVVAIPGNTATFSIEAKGDEPLSYQWRKNGTNIPGATAPQYATDPLTISDHGAIYECVVSNSGGPVVSRPARVLVASSVHRAVEGLQAAYTFEEGTGLVVKDVSGAGGPLNLQILNPEAVEWTVNGLLVREPTLIASAVPATKIIEASLQTHEITVEAWIKASSANQTGPARIVTLSRDPVSRNITVGQGINGGSSSVIDVRYRTTETSMNGTPSVTTPVGTFTSEVTHVVYTRKADGTAQTYINGWPAVEGIVSGDLSNWDTTYFLGLANELTEDRPWLGEFRLVSFYNRALTAQEVVNNYAVNPWPVSTGVEQDGVQGSLPNSFMLYQNSPNPFNPSTRIRYDLPTRTQVELTVYDLLGRKVTTLMDGEQSQGRHEVVFEAEDLASGVYLCRVWARPLGPANRGDSRSGAGAHSATIKLLLVR